MVGIGAFQKVKLRRPVAYLDVANSGSALLEVPDCDKVRTSLISHPVTSTGLALRILKLRGYGGKYHA